MRTQQDHERSRLVEREEISRGLAAGRSLRAIAVSLGRLHCTISREVARNGGRGDYRAFDANTAAYARARCPKTSKLIGRPALRAAVEQGLADVSAGRALGPARATWRTP